MIIYYIERFTVSNESESFIKLIKPLKLPLKCSLFLEILLVIIKIICTLKISLINEIFSFAASGAADGLNVIRLM